MSAPVAPSNPSVPATPSVSANPWTPTVVVMAATIMVVLDSTVVNVALHRIGVELHAEAGVEWVITAYLLAVCAAQPVTGWMAERFGRKQVFLADLAVFTVASAACAAAPSLGALVLFRVLQGFGGGALIPVGMAMMLDLFPRSRHGRAIAVWGMAAMIAPAVGPTLGGWLATSVSWRWLFLVNIPIGIAAFLCGIRLLPSTGHRDRRPFDTAGLLLGSGGLSIAVLGLSQANQWGWGSPATIACLVVGASSVAVFVYHELRTRHPMLELRMFEDRSFKLAMSAMLFVHMAHFARLVFVPLELQSLRGVTPLQVGLLFLPSAIVTALAMLAGGRLADRIGPRLPIVVGCSISFVALVGYARMTLTTPLLVIGILFCAQGFGVGLINAPAMVAGISRLPRRLIAEGTAVRSLVNQVSGAIAVAALGAVVAARMGSDPTPEQAQAAYNSAFAVAAAGVGFSIFLAARLPNRIPVRTEEVVTDTDAEADPLLLATD